MKISTNFSDGKSNKELQDKESNWELIREKSNKC